MRIGMKQMDFAAAARAAVAAMVGLETDLKKYTERKNALRAELFMVAIPTTLTENPEVYTFIKERANVVGTAQKKGTTVTYFCVKEEAKMFRDLCNRVAYEKALRDASRNPDDFRNLVRVHYGPDHRRYVGEVK